MSAPQLVLRRTDAISGFLTQAATSPDLRAELQAAAQELLAGQDVSWSQLRTIASELRQSAGSTNGLLLRSVCHGSQLMLKSPPRREKSKELQDRLLKLQKQVDQASYNRMVSDVTKQERAAAALRSGALQTYKQQISFGLHVAVMMGTFYAVGHIAGTALSPKTSVRAACGLFALVLAMLVETMLLMIETNRFEGPKINRKQPEPSSNSEPSSEKKQ